MIWVWFQHAEKCHWFHLSAAVCFNISEHVPVLTVKVLLRIHQSFVLDSHPQSNKKFSKEFCAKWKVTAPVCWPWKDCRTCEVWQADYRWAVVPEAASSTVPGSYPSAVLAHCAAPLKFAGNHYKTHCVNALTHASYWNLQETITKHCVNALTRASYWNLQETITKHTV